MRIELALGLSMLCLCAGAWGDSRRPLSIDDVLRMQDIGRVVITPDGRSLVYEWMAPYEEAPNLHAYYPGETSPLAKLRRLDLTAASTSSPLFEQQSDGGYWIGDLSPDGSRLAVYSQISDEVKAGVFDFANRRVTWFAFTPNYSEVVKRPVWISADELVYAAMSAGEQPAVLYGAGFMARINRLWQKFRDGRESSATVLVSKPSGVDPVSGRDPAHSIRAGRLIRANARTGEAAVMDEGYFYNFRLSPDRRYLAALREGGELPREPDEPITSLSGRWLQLVIYDFGSRAKRMIPCEDCDTMRGSLQWSADARRLVFLARTTDATALAETQQGLTTLFQYRADTRSLEQISAPGLWLSCRRMHPVAIPVGTGGSVAIFGRPRHPQDEPHSWCESRGRHDWFFINADGAPTNVTAAFDHVSGAAVGVIDSALFVLADGGVWRLELSGTRQRVTRNLNLPVSASIYGSEAPGFNTEAMFLGRPVANSRSLMETDDRIIGLDLRTGSVNVLEKPDRESTFVAAANLPGPAAFKSDSRDGSRQLLLVRKQGKLEPILSINEHLREVAAGEPIQIHYTYEGKPLSSCAIVPPDRQPGRRYPLIVFAYPEISSGLCGNTSISVFDPHNVQLLAAQGYVVLFTANPRELTQTADGPTRALTPVVLAAVDQAVSEGLADPDRLGVFGFSQGFHSALQLITETNRFKAAVVSNGYSDAASHYGSMALANRMNPDTFTVGSMVRFELEASANFLGARPWENPQRYIVNSPIFEAEKIETPVLIMHSDFDGFPLGQSEEIFTALYRLRKEATYVTYWGEGHGNHSPANIRDTWQRTLRWYDEHLDIPRDADGNLIFGGDRVKSREDPPVAT